MIKPWPVMNPDGQQLNEDDVPMTVNESLHGYDFRPGHVIYGRVPTSTETGLLAQLCKLIMVYVTSLAPPLGT